MVLFFVIATIVVSSLVDVGTSYGDSLLAHTMSGAALVAAARATGMRRRPRRVVTVVVLLAVGLLAVLSFAEAVLGDDAIGPVSPEQADPLWLVLVIAVPDHRHPPDLPAHGRGRAHRARGDHRLPADRRRLRRALPGALGVELGAPVRHAAAVERVHLPQPDDDVDARHRRHRADHQVSRLLVSSEAVLGQVFLVTIVAIVVSQFAGTRKKPQQAP